MTSAYEMCYRLHCFKKKKEKEMKGLFSMNICIISFNNCCNMTVSRIQLVVHDPHKFHNRNRLLDLDKMMWSILLLITAFCKLAGSFIDFRKYKDTLHLFETFHLRLKMHFLTFLLNLTIFVVQTSTIKIAQIGKIRKENSDNLHNTIA